MFDLFRSRAKVVRFMLGALLMVVALSMVVTLIPGFGSGGGRQQDQIVAEIGKDAVTVQEVRKRLQMALHNRSVPKEMMQLYVEQLLTALINEHVMAYEARRLGFEVTQEDLVRGLQAMAPMLFQGGQFIGKEAYAALLREQDLSIEEFEASARTQMLVSKLEDLVGQGVLVTPEEVTKEYQRRNEKVKLEYISMKPDQLRSEVTVTPDEVRNYFQANKLQFQIPEKRSFRILLIDAAKVAQRITAPEAELRKYYEANKDQFRTPDRVHVRHILLKTTGKPKEEEPKIRAKAEDLLKQLKAGADFAELAKKNSEDDGSAAKGGDLGWIVRGQTVANFENTAFALKPKDLSGVIATEYGFHILQVLEREQARVKPFEELKEALGQEWKKQQVYDTVQRLADQAHELAAKNPAGAEQIARELGIDVVKVDKAGAGDPVPELGVNADFESAVTGLPKGGVSGVIQAPGNKLAVAVVTGVFPARPAELSEVEAQIRGTLTSQKLEQLIERKARETLEKVKAAGGDLKKVAQSLGLEVKTTQEFGRNGAADGIGPAISVYQAFEQPVGGVFMPGPVGEDRLICKVENKVPADITKLGEQRAAIARTLREDKLKRRTELLEDSLRSALFKEGKLKIHQDVINRLFESYRG
ncbi:MAG: peptidylprolyl isomerase [Bryobacteraceae bacterium]|jgi:peptidyl-prolyl cis-trans isomerase D